jgi:hypothetical protein
MPISICPHRFQKNILIRKQAKVEERVPSSLFLPWTMYAWLFISSLANNLGASQKFSEAWLTSVV